MRRLLVAAAIAMVGCGSGDGDSGGDSHTTHDDTDTHETEEHTHGTGEIGEHIHGIAYWKETDEVVMGTHEGVHRTDAGSADLVTLNDYGDYMGFVPDPFDSDRYWASGHWSDGGYGMWGFIESTDGGETWDEISLNGTADFHQLASAPDTEDRIVGIWDARAWVSDDAGRTWSDWPMSLAATGLAVVGDSVLVAHGQGVTTFDLTGTETGELVSGSISGLDRIGPDLAYSVGSSVFLCDVTATDCTEISAPGTVAHTLARSADDADIVVLTSDDEVHHSDDGGETWAKIVDGG